jgi:predicted ATP-dependent endonuclease of OLD family
MKLSKYEVQNYKSIREGVIRPSEVTLLVGKNNSGKSNLIDSLLSYQRIVSPSLGGINPQNWLEKNAIGKDQENEVQFQATYKLDEQLYNEEIQNPLNYVDNQRDSTGITNLISEIYEQRWLSEVIHQLEITKDGLNEVFFTNFRGEYIDVGQRGRIDFTERTGITDKFTIDIVPIATIRDHIDSWGNIGAFRQPESSMNVHQQDRMDSSGKDLIQVFDTIYRNKPDKFQRIREAYIDIMEGVTDLRTRLRGTTTTTLVEEDLFPDGFTLDEISAGSRQILMLLTKIVIAEGESGLLLLEEPELHIHPKAQQEIIDLIEETTENSNTQIILSTHSKTFVERSDIEDITFVQREGETLIKTISQGSELEESLKDLGYETTNVIQSEKVVFVEGRSDRVILSQLSETRGTPFEEQGVEVVRLKGDEMFENVSPMLELLKQLSIPYLFVLDSDGKNPENKQKNIASRVGASPEEIHVLQQYSIESYLSDSKEAIARAFNIDKSKVDEQLDEPDSERNQAGAIKDLYLDVFNQSSDKASIGGMIARHMKEDEIPGELQNLLERIETLN